MLVDSPDRKPPRPLRVAVIGAGISGLAAAWILSEHHEVTLFEKEERLGGHTHTLEVAHPGGPLGIDCGFVVYNETNYPHFSRLIDHLAVPTKPTDMSFSVQIGPRGEFEWAGSGLRAFFGQHGSVRQLGRWRLLQEMLSFNRLAKARLASDSIPKDLTLAGFLSEIQADPLLVSRYLLPMAASIWSSPTEQVLDHPALALIRFFDHHGLIDLWGRPRWRCVVGGASRYVEALSRKLRGPIEAGRTVIGIRRRPDGIGVLLEGTPEQPFDRAVLACHPDQACRLLEPAFGARAWLGRFSYTENQAFVHQDPTYMPITPSLWSSWNFHAKSDKPEASPVSVTYWMNRLQGLAVREPVFVSLNPPGEPQKTIAAIDFAHPCYDLDTLSAQEEALSWQGVEGLYFAGAWLGSGFHEDGVDSAVALAHQFGLPLPWLEPRSNEGIASGPSHSPAVAVDLDTAG